MNKTKTAIAAIIYGVAAMSSAAHATAQYTDVVHVADLNNRFVDCAMQQGGTYWLRAHRVAYTNAHIVCTTAGTAFITYTSKAPYT